MNTHFSCLWNFYILLFVIAGRMLRGAWINCSKSERQGRRYALTYYPLHVQGRVSLSLSLTHTHTHTFLAPCWYVCVTRCTNFSFLVPMFVHALPYNILCRGLSLLLSLTHTPGTLLVCVWLDVPISQCQLQCLFKPCLPYDF